MKINGFNAETQRTQRFAEGGNFSCHAENLDKPGYLRASPRSPRLCVEKASRSQPSTLNPQPSQRGVALVITLILLSVVTFMAITFLALSRRERSAVTTVTDTASARLAADAALANAEAQVVANVLATTNPYNFSLLVSTNGWPLTFTNLPGDLTYLYVSPRAPVYLSNIVTHVVENRFYLDLNRNGRYDTNGFVLETNFLGQAGINFEVGDPEWIGVLQRPDQPYGPNNPFVARYAFIAVPVGNTLDLNAIYNQAMTRTVNSGPASFGSDGFLRNQGVGSWEINLAAFLTDLNPNQWDTTSDLYNYREYIPFPNNLPNVGRGFEDALSLLSYRYGYNYNSLTNAEVLLNLNGLPGLPFVNGNIDWYSDGLLMTTPAVINVNQNVSLPWAGADNTNHFFTPEELFNSNEISPTFVNSLLAAGNTNSIYENYTFYRLLSQLGTDTAPDSGKMNLNYDNLVQTNPFSGAVSETNFYAWQPLTFFTNAADRLLRAYTTQWRNSNPTNFATTFYAVNNFNFINADQWTNYPAFGITNIPVLVGNQFVYSSAVNRVLQLAANIYDATTNNTFALGNNYPSVFRPLFTRDAGGNVFVTGYTNVESVSGMNDIAFSTPFDVSTISALSTTTTNVLENVYGVPWIIGAKKGFPNFNKFAMQDVVQITRKLQIRRSTIPTTSISDFLYTNQLYIFSISNSIGIDCWNSYSNWYPSLKVQIVVNDNLSMMLNNDGGAPFVVFNTYPQPYSINTNITLTSFWPGSAWNPAVYKGSPAANSFIVPINTTVQFLTNSGFYSGTTPPGATYKGFYPVGDNLGWETNKHDFTFPNFGLLTTNRLQVFMLDQDVNGKYHVIDYVQFAGPDSSRNLNAEFQTSGQASGYGYLWSTNLNADGTPWGIISQIDVSDGMVAFDGTYWNDGSALDEISGFGDFMGYSTANGSSTAQFYKTNYIVQVPYSPTVTASEYISWQANDPLVHYLAGDLNFQGTESGGPTTGINVSTRSSSLPRPSFNLVNDRYQPWGLSLMSGGVDANAWNLAYKDPLVRSSDNWDFPTNKFPTVGWLGRAHRGTPWQTVYLKATNVLNEVQMIGSVAIPIGTKTWAQWTGDTQLTFNQYFDAVNSAPVQDRLLFDLFTTAFNDNATRGTLSVNQNHLAAWSALFSGVMVLSNNWSDLKAGSSAAQYIQFQNPPPNYSVTNIQPAGSAWTNSPLGQLVNGINQTRANTNLFPLQTFTHVGDILSVPQLTEQSPFLKAVTNGVADVAQQRNGISDEMYEWLPQQTMSLLRCSGSPRYVIYCYGQALKPAPNSVYTGGGQFFGMVTNYQVVSEIATRAVVRFGSTVTNVVTANSFGNWFSMPMVTNNNAVIENFNILPPD
jgi:hypothetical protein